MLLGRLCHSIFPVVYHRGERGGERGGEESCDKRANKEVRGWSYPPVTAESNPINNEHLQPLARVSSWLNLGGTSGGVQKEWYNPDLYVLFDFKPLSLVTKRRAKLHRADLNSTCSCNHRPYRRNFDTESDRVWLIQRPMRDPWRVVALRYSLSATG